MTENARKLRDTSNAVVENLDPRVKGRRLRNRMLILAASGVFLYGFAANLPDAMAKYAIERVKIEEESKDSKKKTL
jgi:hypothetical protein